MGLVAACLKTWLKCVKTVDADFGFGTVVLLGTRSMSRCDRLKLTEFIKEGTSQQPKPAKLGHY